MASSLMRLMAVGLAVISVSAIEGPKEIIKHETSGLLVKPGETGGYVEAIRSLAHDPELHWRLVSGARNRWSDEFFSQKDGQSRQWQCMKRFANENRARCNDLSQVCPSFIVRKFLGLLEHGWDAQIVCSTSNRADWKNFPELSNYAGIQRRIHVGWPHRPQWLAILLLPAALLNCLVRNPAGLWHYLTRGLKRFGLGVLRMSYLDASLIAIKPDLVHFEFGSLAMDRMHVKELLDCKVTVSFRGYDLNDPDRRGKAGWL